MSNPPPDVASTSGAASASSMWSFVERAYPICRSITGDGVRRTLALLGERLPLEVHEVPSGTPILDWTVPKEWNLRSARLRGPGGEVIADTARHNLHVVSYSVPTRARLELADLLPHLHSLPERPDWIPYRTSYYQERWGFCLPHRAVERLAPGSYEVTIDATLEDGALTYGECFLPAAGPGATTREVLISAHVCHPSLANDNLSGLAVSMALAEALQARPRRRYGYRFVFAPGTIGAIAWLARNPGARASVAAGLVAANLGDGGGFHYKRSRRGNADIDRAVAVVLRDRGGEPAIEDFVPFGYDERQYCSPGVDLPVGVLTRTPWGRYPEYHTSADDLSFIAVDRLAESLDVYLSVIDLLEDNRTYLNLAPVGEPQLGRRGLYGSLGGATEGREQELALLWVLNQSDGRHSLLDIAERSGVAFARLRQAADRLRDAALLREM
jgi:aminopeptidase-like protein